MPALFPPVTLEIMVLTLGVFLLLAESFSRSADRSWMARWSVAILSTIFAWSFFTTGDSGVDLTNTFYSADATSLFFKRLSLLTTIGVLIISLEFRGLLEKFIPSAGKGAGTGEFFALPVFTCAGLMFMASAVDFLLIFVSLELTTISFYILVAYLRRQNASLEAGVKYLILGALSTGFLVYGITWIFGLTGETNLLKIAEILPSQLAPGGRLYGSESALLFGMSLLIVALGFKIAAAPFQLWVPDVYQGAPTPVTAFLSVGSKAAGFLVLIRVLQPFLFLPTIGPKLIALLTVLAALSLVYGNLAALPQDNLKRLLAYSSIGHAGYLLVAIASVNPDSHSLSEIHRAVGYYLGGYLLMTLLSFLVLTIVAGQSRGDDIAHFNGLYKRSPILTLGMVAAMASLAGIPLTAGFYGKFLVFTAAVAQQKFTLVGIGIVTVAAGFYFYFRVIAAMFWKEPAEIQPIAVSGLSKIAILLLTAAIVLLGIFPGPILDALSSTGKTAALVATQLQR
jgi:NADH-quinone oxidoreductase subunit N